MVFIVVCAASDIKTSVGIYHSATFPAIPKSIVAVTTPNALNTLLIVGIVML